MDSSGSGQEFSVNYTRSILHLSPGRATDSIGRMYAYHEEARALCSEAYVSALLLIIPLLSDQGSHYPLSAALPTVSRFLDHQAVLSQPDVGHQVRLRTWQNTRSLLSSLSPGTAQRAKGSAGYDPAGTRKVNKGW